MPKKGSTFTTQRSMDPENIGAGEQVAGAMVQHGDTGDRALGTTPAHMAPLTIELSRPKIERMLTFIRGGNFLSTAAVLAGLKSGTVRLWLSKADDNNPDSPYSQLRDQVDTAAAYAEARDVQVIDRAAQAGDWKAAMTRLERRNPKHWAKRDEQLHTVDGAVEIKLSWGNGGELGGGEIIDAEVVEDQTG